MMNNNKESFKLLSVAGSGSESESEIPEFVLTPKKKRLKRRTRTNHMLTRAHDTQPKFTCSRRNISLVLAAVFLFCWLFTLSWLTVLLHGNMQQLDEMVQRVVAGSQAVPDDLQKIHSLSRELQQNQSQLALKVNSIAAQVANLSQQVIVVQTGLRAYSDQLESNPEPSNMKELKENVATLGSQISDLNNTVKSLKQKQASLETITQTFGKNLTAVEGSISQLSNASLRPAPLEPNVAHTLDNLHQVLAQTSANISNVNSTLTQQLQWLKDDHNQDHKEIEALREFSPNFTARIKTLEGECAKVDVQNFINTTLFGLKEQVILNAQRLNFIEHALPSSPQTASSVTQSNAKAPADTGSIVTEEAKDSLPATIAESVGGSITTPGG